MSTFTFDILSKLCCQYVLYFYLSEILNAGLLTVTEYFYIVVFLLLLSKWFEYFSHHFERKD